MCGVCSIRGALQQICARLDPWPGIPGMIPGTVIVIISHIYITDLESMDNEIDVQYCEKRLCDLTLIP